MPDAARYHRLQLVLAAAGLALSIACLVALLLTGAAHALARAAATATDSAWGQIAIVAGVLAGAHALLTFPLAWTRGWWLPRRYGLLHQSLRGWLADRAKAALLAAAPGPRRSRGSTRSSARRPPGGSGPRPCSSPRTG